ncbi:MAG: RNA 2',3'-cyclic phosphodiesterase [Melioribacteraceae bacterium]|nr:MAG: RNA 2',3'-cyclic phosphodiesterase [Melioribacteraceae bacterium]
MTNRLFISADLDEEIKNIIIKIRDEIYGFDRNIKWETKDKLHFTLKFLGEVEQNKNHFIISELEKVTKNYKTINCSFASFGLFKKGVNPSILWLGINYNNDFNNLAKTINNNLFNYGFPKESRTFKPHLTLLRIKGKEDLKGINDFLDYKLPEIKFNINKLSLMKSELHRSGSVYSQIKSFKLN